ncbi:hypothetical protein BDW59DRAFT_139179 [Aspergillus cavernicola]|uniref:Uncharacterized protein n=1 Tax=Aspergillus cavernicola TaxID=176166 RepID=A0ABR4IX97_9EURO
MEPPPQRSAYQRRSPSRPSFRAPTKASLARSHPDILERSLSRSPTRKSAQRGSKNDQQKDAETRAFGLRDRKALRPSITLTTSPSDSLRQGQESPVAFPSRRSSGLGAFAAPPRRVSKRISASDFMFQSPMTPQENITDASMINTPEDQLATELVNATGATDLSVDLEAGPSLHDGFNEPDLPPTPTQLGLERPPGRPRGLLSSSPSVQHAKWGRRRATGDLEQSPSKLRTVDYGAEAEDLTDHVTTMNDALFPGSVFKKRKLRRELSADLETLKQDITKLEGLCEKLDRHEENIEPYLNDLGSSLNSTDLFHINSSNSRSRDGAISSFISTLLPFSTKRPLKPLRLSPEVNPFALDKSQTESYLSAFAPLKLTASSNIISTSNSDSFSEKHQLVLSAPRPFPPNLYKISVSYETNPETQKLVSLSAKIEASTPNYLQQWIDRRLASPLLKLDVSGLCWGINRYWEALVSRAQIWAQIEDQHLDLILGHRKRINSAQPEKIDPNNTELLTIPHMRRILPHLERTSIIFGSKQRSLKVILSCELTVDEWTGEPDLSPNICISTPGFESGSNEKVEQESTKLFQAMLSENTNHQPGTAGGSGAQAIINATNCVLDALFGVDAGSGRKL